LAQQLKATARRRQAGQSREKHSKGKVERGLAEARLSRDLRFLATARRVKAKKSRAEAKRGKSLQSEGLAEWRKAQQMQSRGKVVHSNG